MSSDSDNDVSNRRVSSRIEEILTGWWRQQDSKFQRLKTLDLSMEGSLLVMDSKLADGETVELHLDMEADWSIALDATILWQRPIFFGKQQLTAVTYSFQKIRGPVYVRPLDAAQNRRKAGWSR